VEIVAQPPGKKLQNVLLLSGGEKALAALALLIALFRYRPVVLCARRSRCAIGRRERRPLCKHGAGHELEYAVIVITHSKRTMETATTLYGVTMEEPGISKIVSVRLN